MKSIATACLVLACSQGQGQNLVLNGSFEEYITCPTSFGQWGQAIGWISPFTESADYYNACAGGVVCSVPLNTCGYQYPANGNAYMGIITYSTLQGGLYREVIATELTEPLQPGVPVYCTYKVSPGGFGSNTNNSATWASKGPGLNFFNHLPQTSQPFLFSEWATYMFPNNADVDMPGVLNDTSNWVTVGGFYVPDSAYSWLAIANYFENNESQIELLDSTAQSNKAYAFIDDVQVTYYPTSVVSNSGELSSTDKIAGTLHDGLLTLCGGSMAMSSDLALVDLFGQVIWCGRWPEYTERITAAIHGLSASVYLLRIQPEQGTPRTLRLVHVQP